MKLKLNNGPWQFQPDLVDPCGTIQDCEGSAIAMLYMNDTYRSESNLIVMVYSWRMHALLKKVVLGEIKAKDVQAESARLLAEMDGCLGVAMPEMNN